jgi:hypothetical protein
LRKHKNDNANANKRKRKHANTKMSKMPKLPVYNDNGVKHKPLKRNVLSSTPILPSPTATDVFEKKKKHFTSKYKNEYIKHVCTVKSHKLLHKLDKNHKFAKSNTTMRILHAKSNLRLAILHVIILDPNTMKSNATASSSLPCPSSLEAMIPKSTFHGH